MLPIHADLIGPLIVGQEDENIGRILISITTARTSDQREEGNPEPPSRARRSAVVTFCATHRLTSRSRVLRLLAGIISSEQPHPRVQVGTALGPFTLLELVTREMRAQVWTARHEDGTTQTLRVRSGVNAGRVVPELRRLRTLGLATVYDAGSQDDIVWQATEHVRGRPFVDVDVPLSDRVARVDRAISLGASLCRTLAELHAAGLWHGGLTPDRTLVDLQGHLHLVDVGAGTEVGPYTPPEHVGHVPHDARVDVFSAGVMLFELVAGPREPPEPPVCWHDVQCLERLPDLATWFVEVPRALSTLLQEMTAIDPRDRPSAREVADRLDALGGAAVSAEWPEPPFVDPGPWWYPLRSCIGAADGPHTWVLDGPTGSGRRRLAERLHRETLLRGRWTLHARCRADRLGSVLTDLLETVVHFLDPRELRDVAQDDGGIIRQFWPHLPIPGAPDPDHPHATQAAEAAVALITRIAERHPVLVVLHGLEQADSMSLRALPHLVRRSGPNLGVLMLHEARWAHRASAAVIGVICDRLGAGLMEMRRWPGPRACTLGSALCPEDPPMFTQPMLPYAAWESSLHVLAEWRGESFEPPDGATWPLVIHDEPVPKAVVTACGCAALADSPWVVEDADGLSLAGPTARRLASPRLTDLRRTAAALAAAWDRARDTFGGAPGPIATRWILAGKTAQAWTPAARAAVMAAHHDRFRQARQWLQILDTLDQPTARDQDLEFLLVHARARTALYLDPHSPTRLAAQTERSARTDVHRSWARLLRAERAWRHGDFRGALVKALRAGAPTSGAPPEVQIHALLVALRSRIRLGEPSGIERDLLRVQALHTEAPFEAPTRLGLVRAELAYLRDDLLWCRAVCEETLRTAEPRQDEFGTAAAAYRMASVWRRLGRRPDAERHAHAARDAAEVTGDPALQADTTLLLAALWAERGRWLPAERLLQTTLRRIDTLGLRLLKPSATRLSLQLSVMTRNLARGRAALLTLQAADWDGSTDDEWPAALVSWHRMVGDLTRALEVSPGSSTAYGTALWHLERARAGLDGDAWGLVSVEASHAIEIAARHGFEEITVQAGLLRGLVNPIDDDAWSAMVRKAAASPCVACSLGALELDARRHDGQAAANRWLHLLAQARQRGYLPAVEEAGAWLSSLPTTR